MLTETIQIFVLLESSFLNLENIKSGLERPQPLELTIKVVNGYYHIRRYTL